MEFLLLAQLAQPVPKLGTCPIGYYSQGSYCVPSTSQQWRAIQRVGQDCPIGWYQSGSYCTQTR